MLGAGVALAEHHRFAADNVNDHQAVGLSQRSLDGIRQAAAHGIVDDQTINNNLHRVLDVLFEADFLAQVIHIAIDAHAGKTGAAGGVQFLGLGAFAGTDDRGQYLEAGALGQLKHLVHHLIHGLLGDFPAADRAVRHADTSVHQAQVVVNLGDRAHGGTRVVAGGFLVDGDCRGQAGDFVHIGLFHLP